ncbi:MAG: thiamine-phosphate kinase [Pseudomonadota bacterium]
MSSEFELIARFFTRAARDAVLGVGDDAALLRPRAGAELAVSTDMLVAGRHFLPDADPYLLGHKTLAVNLSDLAAMGAAPRWATLALALPEADEAWLSSFSQGLLDLADRFDVDLVGGDTTRGPLNLCVTVLGEVPAGRALRRDAARPGDDIWVSGDLGGAALGLRERLGELALPAAEAAACHLRLDAPEPRIALGQALLGVAHAAIDLSDGLLADLGHILARSGVGAELMFEQLPAHPAVSARLDTALARRCLLAGGDDYELCFTAPPERSREVLAAGEAAGVKVSWVGRIGAAGGLRLLGPDGLEMPVEARGYDHFA